MITLWHSVSGASKLNVLNWEAHFPTILLSVITPNVAMRDAVVLSVIMLSSIVLAVVRWVS